MSDRNDKTGPYDWVESDFGNFFKGIEISQEQLPFLFKRLPFTKERGVFVYLFWLSEWGSRPDSSFFSINPSKLCWLIL